MYHANCDQDQNKRKRKVPRMTDPRKGKAIYKGESDPIPAPETRPGQPAEPQDAISPTPAKAAKQPDIANLEHNSPKQGREDATQGPKQDQPIPRQGGNKTETSATVIPAIKRNHHISKGKADHVCKETPLPLARATQTAIELRPPNLSDKHNQLLIDSLFRSDEQASKLHKYKDSSIVAYVRAKHPQYWRALLRERDQILPRLAEGAAVDGTMIIKQFLQSVRSGKIPVESVKDASFLTSMVTQLSKVVREAPAPTKAPDTAGQQALEQASLSALGKLGK